MTEHRLVIRWYQVQKPEGLPVLILASIHNSLDGVLDAQI